MDSAAVALHFAALARLRADAALAALGIDADRDVTTKPGQSQALPYVVVGLNTEAAAVFAATSAGPSVGTDNVLGGTAWSTSYDRALALAAACVEALAAAPVAADGYTFHAVPEPFLGPPFEDGAAEASAGAWGCPWRLRWRVHRPIPV